jgi:hypothetical protein
MRKEVNQMQTLQLSPELNNVVKTMKNQALSKADNQAYGEHIVSAIFLSGEESDAVTKTFNKQQDLRTKAPQEPKCYWV